MLGGVFLEVLSICCNRTGAFLVANITHRFIASNFVKMLPVIYEKHEKVH